MQSAAQDSLMMKVNGWSARVYKVTATASYWLLAVYGSLALLCSMLMQLYGDLPQFRQRDDAPAVTSLYQHQLCVANLAGLNMELQGHSAQVLQTGEHNQDAWRVRWETEAQAMAARCQSAGDPELNDAYATLLRLANTYQRLIDQRRREPRALETALDIALRALENGPKQSGDPQ